MLKPSALGPGARVAVVALASPFDRGALAAGLEELARLGFEPVVDDRLFDQRGYVAADAAARTAAFLAAWRDPAVGALVAARGGYGSVHLLPQLRPELLRATPKIFVGHSDLTSLLAFLSLGCGIVSFHGPTVAGRLSRGVAGYDRDSFLRCLTRPEPAGEFAPPDLEVVRPGEARGPLFGGTLTLVAASLGTPYAFRPPPGAILFLDEVGERPYRIDRLLTQLRLAGIFAAVAGVVFGELVDCDEPGGPITAREVVRELMATFAGPVAIGFPSGHTRGATWTLPFGVSARLVATSRPRLVIEEAAVR